MQAPSNSSSINSIKKIGSDNNFLTVPQQPRTGKNPQTDKNTAVEGEFSFSNELIAFNPKNSLNLNFNVQEKKISVNVQDTENEKALQKDNKVKREEGLYTTTLNKSFKTLEDLKEFTIQCCNFLIYICCILWVIILVLDLIAQEFNFESMNFFIQIIKFVNLSKCILPKYKKSKDFEKIYNEIDKKIAIYLAFCFVISSAMAQQQKKELVYHFLYLVMFVLEIIYWKIVRIDWKIRNFFLLYDSITILHALCFREESNHIKLCFLLITLKLTFVCFFFALNLCTLFFKNQTKQVKLQKRVDYIMSKTLADSFLLFKVNDKGEISQFVTVSDKFLTGLNLKLDSNSKDPTKHKLLFKNGNQNFDLMSVFYDEDQVAFFSGFLQLKDFCLFLKEKVVIFEEKQIFLEINQSHYKAKISFIGKDFFLLLIEFENENFQIKMQHQQSNQIQQLHCATTQVQTASITNNHSNQQQYAINPIRSKQNNNDFNKRDCQTATNPLNGTENNFFSISHASSLEDLKNGVISQVSSGIPQRMMTANHIYCDKISFYSEVLAERKRQEQSNKQRDSNSNKAFKLNLLDARSNDSYKESPLGKIRSKSLADSSTEKEKKNVEDFEAKYNGLKDLMHMVIHDLRNPAYLIDSNLDQLAEMLTIDQMHQKHSNSPKKEQIQQKKLTQQSSLENANPSKFQKNQKKGNEIDGRYGTGGTGEEMSHPKLDRKDRIQIEIQSEFIRQDRLSPSIHSKPEEGDKNIFQIQENMQYESDKAVPKRIGSTLDLEHRVLSLSVKSQDSCFTFNNSNQIENQVPMQQKSQSQLQAIQQEYFQNPSIFSFKPSTKDLEIDGQIEEAKSEEEDENSQSLKFNINYPKFDIKKAEENYQTSKYACQMITNLINDLLDQAKLENNTFIFYNQYFNLIEVVQKAIKMISAQSNKKKINIEFEYEEGKLQLYQNIYGDERRYNQVLLNFMSNAVKFTPVYGSIKIQLELQEVFEYEIIRSQTKTIIYKLNQYQSNYENGQGIQRRKSSVSSTSNERKFNLILKITDSGKGISKEDVEKLFVKFNKLEDKDAINKEGTGLGLSICKLLVEQMGGHIKVESQLSEGTCFTVVVPTKCQNQTKIRNRASEEFKLQRHFDMGENDMEGNLNASMQVKGFMSSSSKQGSFYNQLAGGNSGNESYFDPIINTTSNFEIPDTDTQKFQNLDIYMMLEEFHKNDLSELNRHASQLRILNVDDDPSILECQGILFQSFGFNVDSSYTGQEALEKIKHGRYHIAFIDLSMPFMDGRQLCKKIQQLSLSRIPFLVALSGYNYSKTEKIQLQEMGFQHLITKPINKMLVSEVLRIYQNKCEEKVSSNQKSQCNLIKKENSKLITQQI